MVVTKNVIVIYFFAHSSASIYPPVKVLQFLVVDVLLKFCENILYFLSFITLTFYVCKLFPIPKIVFHLALSEIVPLLTGMIP